MNIELLEPRIAPAAVFTFTDVDGDTAEISSTKGTNTDLTAAAHVTDGQLTLLDLTGAVFQGATIKIKVTTVASKGDGFVNVGYINATGRDLLIVEVHGDLGRIDAGDNEVNTSGISALTVASLGRLGTSTQDAAPSPSLLSTINGALFNLTVNSDVVEAHIAVQNVPSVRLGISMLTIGGSLIGGNDPGSGEIEIDNGMLGQVKIGGDIRGGAGQNSGSIRCDGTVTSVTVGGSLFGGAGVASGEIQSESGLGPVTIGGDLRGGSATNAGKIASDGKIGAVTIGGSVIGGTAQGTGFIQSGGESDGDMGKVTIGGDLRGGSGVASGRIEADGKIAGVTIGGSAIAGGGEDSATISADSDIGPITIGGDVKGGAGSQSGRISANGHFAGITIVGSLIGGDGNESGEIKGDMGSTKAIAIGGDMLGGGVFGDTSGSGRITIDGFVTSLSVGGSVTGGAGSESGFIALAGGAQSVTIGGGLTGGVGNDSGEITGGTITSIAIGGSVTGGSGNDSGEIDPDLVKTIAIHGSLIGGAGNDSGEVDPAKMGGVFVVGSVIGGSGSVSGAIDPAATIAALRGKSAFRGGGGPHRGGGRGVNVGRVVFIGGSLIGGTHSASGFISSDTLSLVNILGDIRGGSIAGTDATLDETGYVSATRIGKVGIGGSIFAGTDDSTAGELTRNGSIRSGNEIGPITIGGSLVGSVGTGGDATLVIISARGQAIQSATKDIAIGGLTVSGSVQRTNILAGYDTSLAAVNGDAQIGAVKIAGDWIMSNLVAGVMDLGLDDAPGGTGLEADNVNYGGVHDVSIGAGNANITSRIASITIGGQVLGTPDAVSTIDHFGFTADEIGSFQIGGIDIRLAFDAIKRDIGITGDVSIRKI